MEMTAGLPAGSVKRPGLCGVARQALIPATKWSALVCVLLVTLGAYAPLVQAADGAVPAAPRLGNAGALIGLPAENNAGERLGKVVDAVTVVDRQGGQVSYMLLSRAALDADDRLLYPVPAPALGSDPAGQRLVLDMTGDELQATDGFRPNKWPAMTDRNWGEKVHAEFGLTPYWKQPGRPVGGRLPEPRQLPVE